jgi:hypothetical protein
MTKYYFKNPGEVITRRGHADLHSGNLTDEAYHALVKEFPGYESHFEQIEEVKPTKKVKDNGKEKQPE